METVSTLATGIIKPGRRVGNTTRQADLAIQLLFAGCTVKVLDHHEEGQNATSNRNLMNIIIRRLGIEHQGLYQERGSVIVDSGNFLIELKKTV